MANRFFNQFRLSLEKQVVDIFGRVTIGGTGAPTLVAAQSKGIVSVTRTATGRYVFVFGTNTSLLDTYGKLLKVAVTFDESSNSGTAPVSNSFYVFANAISTSGTASVTVQFTNSTGTGTDPASTEAILITFTFRNSTP